MKAPDGSYDADFVLPGATDEERKQYGGGSSSSNANEDGYGGGAGPPLASTTRLKLPMDLELNNPLSLHNEVGSCLRPPL